MPMITIKYDDQTVRDEQVLELSKAIQTVVREATKINEVFVYADSPKIKVDVAPIEVFIEMSESKVVDREGLFLDIRNGIAEWKKVNDFDIPITVTLIPVDWKFEVGL